MFPFVPPDYRVVTTMILLFALSNAVERRSHVRPGERKPGPSFTPDHGRDVDETAAVATA